MMCVLILDRITGKNHDFLKLGYFSCFQWGQNLSKFSAMPISSQYIIISANAVRHVKVGS